jgi:hypothetical protein
VAVGKSVGPVGEEILHGLDQRRPRGREKKIRQDTNEKTATLVGDLPSDTLLDGNPFQELLWGVANKRAHVLRLEHGVCQMLELSPLDIELSPNTQWRWQGANEHPKLWWESSKKLLTKDWHNNGEDSRHNTPT